MSAEEHKWGTAKEIVGFLAAVLALLGSGFAGISYFKPSVVKGKIVVLNKKDSVQPLDDPGLTFERVLSKDITPQYTFSADVSKRLSGGGHFLIDTKLPSWPELSLKFPSGEFYKDHNDNSAWQLKVFEKKPGSGKTDLKDRLSVSLNGEKDGLSVIGGIKLDEPPSPKPNQKKGATWYFPPLSVFAAENDNTLKERLASDNVLTKLQARGDLAYQGEKALPFIQDVLENESTYRLRVGVIVALNKMFEYDTAKPTGRSLSPKANCAIVKASKDEDDELLRSLAQAYLSAAKVVAKCSSVNPRTVPVLPKR